MAQRSQPPIRRYAKVQYAQDREFRKILISTSEAAMRIMLREQGRTRVSDIATRAQTAARLETLKTELGGMWRQVDGRLRQRIGDVTAAAYEAQRDMDRTLLRTLRRDQREMWDRSQHVAVERLIRLYRQGRYDSGHPLSRKVYHANALSTGRVVRKVRQDVLLGKSAKQIAQDVRDDIRPDTPGGVSYAAMRLGRTELQSAFHAAQQESMKDNPAVSGAKWHLSNRHPEPDECDLYADEDLNGLGIGVFPLDEVPPKPHPNCLCYLTSVQPTESEFIADMRRFLEEE